MREIRIHVDSTLQAGVELTLPAGAATHVQRVLRLRPGAPLTLFNGRGGEYRATLLSAERNASVVRIDEFIAVERESPLQLTLLQGVSRGERMDSIVQKATELGVTRIAPALTEFSVVKLDAEAAARRCAHWQAIAAGACEQSGRNQVPVVEVPRNLASILAGLSPAAASMPRIVLAPEAPQSLLEMAAAAAPVAALTLLIGPEGGLSERELRLAERAGFSACRLGPRVLRTETAPLVALSVLQTLLGDFR